MSSFQDGYAFFEKNIGVIKGSDNASLYVDHIETEINKFIETLNDKGLRRANVGSGQFQGNIAEFWHANTFNINALARESESRATVLESNKLASVDIATNFDRDYSLKYYKYANQSADHQQYVTVFEKYKASGLESYDEFVMEKGFDGLDPSLSLYQGQGRIVPADQLSSAKEYIKRKLNKELYNRPEQAPKYEETLNQLDDRVRDGQGSESIPLSRQNSEELAKSAQKGEVDEECLKRYGLSLDEVVKYEYVFKQAMKAGVTAAVITTVLKLAPEVLKAVSYLIKTGRLNQEQFKSMGVASLSGASLGFVRGSIAAGLTTACKAGLWGTSLKGIHPSVIATLTVLTFETIGDAYRVACGKMENQELALNLIKNMVVSSSALICGGLTQTALFMFPTLGFMLGSFVGATLGSFACKIGGSAFLSLCVDTGFTMFGLVDQNYELPQEVFDYLNIGTFKIDSFDNPKFALKSFDFDHFNLRRFEFDCFEIKALRRGVVAVSKIGYI